MDCIATKKITWKDFTLEEHMRAYVNDKFGIPPNCIFQVKSAGKDVYRYNIIDEANQTFVDSKILQVITTPDGYIFRIAKY